LAVTVLAGCQVEASPPAAKSGTGELRTDLEPLVKRFPTLTTATGARWMSGTFGRTDTPGPSTYWIDAVVVLEPSEVERLVSAHAPTATGEKPDVIEELREQLPHGPFLTGDALDAAFKYENWRVDSYLARESGELVLVAMGT
jgi:hypothetical protein